MEPKSGLSSKELETKIALLERRVLREKTARETAEKLLEEKSLELYTANQVLSAVNKSLEKKVFNRNETLTALIKSLNSGVLVADENHRIILVNDRFSKLFGISEDLENPIGTDCQSLFAQSSYLFLNPREFRAAFNNCLKNRVEVTGETLQMIDGTVLSSDFIPILTDQQFHGYLWLFNDVTRESEAQNAIIQSEEKYRGIIENMELGLLEVDNNHKILRAYTWFCDMTGYSEEELIGRDAVEIFLPEEEKLLMNRQDKLRAEGKQGVYETRIKKKNGELLWVLISGAPFYDEHGDMAGSIGIHYDITSRKRLEEELRTSRMQTDRLREMEKEFLANMSHEIRNPINAIIGLSNLLYDTKPTIDQQSLIDKIKFSADILQGLISDVLDFSKIESGSLELLEKPIDLRESLQAILDISGFKVLPGKIKFDLRLDTKYDFIVEADPTVINQIFLNLISNSVKFTEEGTISIYGKLLDSEDDRQHYEFKIVDTGIGIPEERLSLIFENFQQADKETKLKYGGTGLGLAIVKRLVMTYGGNITVISTLGKGSEFVFDLWLRKADKATKEERMDIRSVSEQLILIVEDNRINQQYLSGLLKNWNIQYHIANNGKEAIDLVANQKYDMILMDIRMPVMDGYEATIRIRSDSHNENQNTPIVALTASALVDEKERALAAGMNYHLTKPFTPQQLADIFKKFEIVEIRKFGAAPQFSFNPRLDRDYLDQLYDGDLERAEIIFTIFMENIDQELNKMMEHFHSKNVIGFSQQAHKLKPNFHMVGITELGKWMQQFERAKEDLFDQEHLQEKINEFFDEFKVFKEIVKTDLNRLKKFRAL